MIRKTKKRSPEISTASLPDIIFMLLFFFMTVTVLKTSTSKVKVDLPNVAMAEKLGHEASEFNIFIGEAKDGASSLQLNDYIVSNVQLNKVFEKAGEGLTPHEKMEFPVFLRVHRTTKMDVVYDVKLLLRKNGFRKINYIVLGSKS